MKPAGHAAVAGFIIIILFFVASRLARASHHGSVHRLDVICGLGKPGIQSNVAPTAMSSQWCFGLAGHPGWLAGWPHQRLAHGAVRHPQS